MKALAAIVVMAASVLGGCAAKSAAVVAPQRAPTPTPAATPTPSPTPTPALPAGVSELRENPDGALRARLANGLRVVALPIADCDALIQQLWLPAGSLHEVEGHSGVAHLWSHLLHSGAPGDAVSIPRRVATVGGVSDAGSDRELTWFEELTAPGELALLLSLSAERLSRRYDDSALEAARRTALSERLTRIDNDPRGILRERLLALRFGEHPFARLPVGVAQDLESLDLTAIRAFRARHHRIDGAVLVLAGAVDPPAAITAAGAALGALASPYPEPAAAPSASSPPPAPTHENAELDRGAEEEAVLVAFSAPPRGSEARDVFAALRRRLAAELPGAHLDTITGQTRSVLLVGMDGGEDALQRLREAIGTLKVLEQLRPEPAAPVDPRARTREVAVQTLLGDWAPPAEVTAEALRAAATRYLDLDAATILRLRPPQPVSLRGSR